MAWIESHQSLVSHPKTRRAARALSISIPAMIGHLHLFWHWALDYAQDGNVSVYDALDIADAAQWEGDADAFLDALINAGPGDSPGFLHRNGPYGPPDNQQTADLVINDWWDYAGKLIARRQADAARKRETRSTESTANPEDVPRTSNGRRDDGVRNRTLTVPRENTATDKPSRARRRDPVFETIVTECYGKPHTEITETERKRANKAAKELRDLEATSADIQRRAEQYRIRSPGFALTPQTLTKCWTDLGRDPTPNEPTPAYHREWIPYSEREDQS